MRITLHSLAVIAGAIALTAAVPGGSTSLGAEVLPWQRQSANERSYEPQAERYEDRSGDRVARDQDPIYRPQPSYEPRYEPRSEPRYEPRYEPRVDREEPPPAAREPERDYGTRYEPPPRADDRYDRRDERYGDRYEDRNHDRYDDRNDRRPPPYAERRDPRTFEMDEIVRGFEGMVRRFLSMVQSLREEYGQGI